MRAIDANPLDRRERTRGSCRRGPSIRQLLLWECHYDEGTVSLPLAACRWPAPAGGAARFRAARRSAGTGRASRTSRTSRVAPHIVLHAPGNLRRLCVLSGAERCAQGFLP
ncbi:hypothetical protein [Burkholderia sp. Nafp2/4-1b]|uniref:hypothetical protein n=1 Tax=Burkholderia sp. Nafp2/4-1b TaxID=2116686 RepID=UPI0013CEF20C|nr:hypothetical protein [Burkholderia sp. Nafp2/4-1b]